MVTGSVTPGTVRWLWLCQNSDGLGTQLTTTTRLGITAADVKTLVDGLNAGPTPKCEAYLCPPSLYLQSVQATAAPHFNVAAQNSWKHTKGAYTGEISPEMLVDSGIKWTLIGHSERRDIFGETDELLGEKIAHAQAAGMTVVACCGEHKEDRESGATMDVVVPQLDAIIANTEDWSRLVIAYEPVWAIGTGLVATPEQAQETHADIRAYLAKAVSPAVADAVRIQYGGSANADNVFDLLAGEDIDGFLVGGASLKVTPQLLLQLHSPLHHCISHARVAFLYLPSRGSPSAHEGPTACAHRRTASTPSSPPPRSKAWGAPRGACPAAPSRVPSKSRGPVWRRATAKMNSESS